MRFPLSALKDGAHVRGDLIGELGYGSNPVDMLTFTSPADSKDYLLVTIDTLDWALLLKTITIGSADGSVIDGRVVVDQCEKRWSFTPASPWIAGLYHIRVGSSLEDVCGNSITGAFDRPLRKDRQLVAQTNGASLIFQLI